MRPQNYWASFVTVFVVLALVMPAAALSEEQKRRKRTAPTASRAESAETATPQGATSGGAKDPEDGRPEDGDEPEPVVVSDPSLRARLQDEGRLATAAGLAGLQEFKAENAGIRSLEGLQFASDLQKLLLRGNKIADLSPLGSLSELRVLDLSNNPVGPNPGLSPLINLAKLEKLTLSKLLRIGDFSPLARLSSLTKLRLNGTHIEDENLRELTGLERLNYLDLSEAPRLRHVSELLTSRMPQGAKLLLSCDAVALPADAAEGADADASPSLRAQFESRFDLRCVAGD